jgi:hypothetical protein
MTKSTYEVIETSGSPTFIRKVDAEGKVWNIPMDPANSDYAAYLTELEPEAFEAE